MNIEAILEDIAEDMNKGRTAEEVSETDDKTLISESNDKTPVIVSKANYITPEQVRERNIDELFGKADGQPIHPLSFLLRTYLKHLPEGYSIELKRHTRGLTASACLKKQLASAREKIDGAVVEHENKLTVQFAYMILESPFNEAKRFRKIGDILDKIKAAYDAIEKYEETLQPNPFKLLYCKLLSCLLGR